MDSKEGKPSLGTRDSKQTTGWAFKEPNQPYRFSFASDLFHGTFHVEDIGQAVPVRDQFGDDDMSLESEKLVLLGRLNTIQAVNMSSRLPELTVNTAVENVVPPRLKRRPVSEFIPLRQQKAVHRMSLNLNDDLDKLMESATKLQSEEKMVGSWIDKYSPSTDSFHSAGSVGSVDRTPPRMLPKRPNPDDLKRARQVSAQYSAQGDVTIEGKSPESLKIVDPVKKDLDILGSPETLRYVDSVKRDSENLDSPVPVGNLRVVNADTLRESSDYLPLHRTFKFPALTPKESSLAAAERPNSGKPAEGSLKNDSAVDRHEVHYDLDESAYPDLETPKLGSTEHPDVATPRLESTEHPELVTPKLKRATNPDLMTPKLKGADDPDLVTPVRDHVLEFHATPVYRQNISQQVEQLRESTLRLASKRDKSLPDPPTLLERSEISPSKNQTSPYTETYRDDDNEYYDIDEPVLVQKPARVKSVKHSTLMPKRKSTTKRKSRRKRDTSLLLKPFSYNTLIHLLESVNGTVIGEEFESLNLPIKEKQLIEKIVDSLSRLTLDMVIDENRYEIGLERLEKAHRVLEGFL